MYRLFAEPLRVAGGVKTAMADDEKLQELIEEVKDLKEKITKPKSIAQYLDAKSKD